MLANSQYGSYVGTYAQTYTHFFNPLSSELANSITKQSCTRAPDNQVGADADYSGVDAKVKTTVISNQKPRDIFDKRTGCMHANAHEGRFRVINDTTPTCGKFKTPLAPDLAKRQNIGLDLFEFPKCNSNIAENVHNLIYDYDHSILMDNLRIGEHDFEI
jgi:hypothetical protein